MLTWLDVGNGWRNLYLLSCAVQALALGVAFWRGRALMGRRLPSFFAGMAVTPFAQWLWMLLMGLVWPAAPRLLLIGALPVLATGYLLGICVRCRRAILPALRGLLATVRGWTHGKAGDVLCATLALAMAVILLPVGVRMATGSQASSQDSGQYLALSLRYAETRDLGQLMEKNVTDGHFVGHGHFPSLELYESYAFLHAGGTMGYPADKPVFAAIGMLSFYLVLALSAALLLLTRNRWKATALGMLLVLLVPSLYVSLTGSPRDLWRFLGMLAMLLFLLSVRPEGRWPAVLGKALLALVVGFACMATHVVLFVVLPFLVVAWVLVWWLGAMPKAAATLGRAVVIALGAAAGVVLAFAGNIRCYLEGGAMLPRMLIDSFTDASWYPLYDERMHRAEAISTTIPIWQDPDRVLLGHVSPIGWIGLCCALVLLGFGVAMLIRRRRARRASGLITSPDSLMRARLCLALSVPLTLLPMTGLLDTPVYAFSGAFTVLGRYTMQWFLLAALVPSALLSAWEERAPAWAAALSARLPKLRAGALRSLPALITTLACVGAFAGGTSTRGYTDNVYRMTVNRGLLEDPAYAQDNAIRTHYHTLLSLSDHVAEDQKILITEQGDQYATRARAYYLLSDAYCTLLVTPETELARALADANVAVIATGIRFWDERFFAHTALDAYLRTLPPEQIVEDGTMRFYLLDATLAEPVAVWAGETRAFAASLEP